MKKQLVQGVLIIAAGIVLALVSNAVAGRERKLVLPGYYPNALRVPPPPAERPPGAVAKPLPAAQMVASREIAVQPQAPLTTDTSPTPIPTTTALVPKTTAKPPSTEPTPLQRFPPHPDKPYVEISGQDAAWLHRKGVLFLDARRSSVYAEGHIAGARSFSVWESDIDQKVNQLFDERGDPEKQLQPIVIYCSGGACEDSHMLAEKLWGIQFNNVLVYKDGFPDWQKRRGRVRAGNTP